jgi:hypothetical protein
LVTNTDPKWGTKLVQRVPQPHLDFLNVRYILTAPGRRIDESLTRLYEGPDGNLYENPRSLPRFFAPRSWRPTNGEIYEELSQIRDFRELVLVGESAGRGGYAGPGVETLDARQVRPGVFRLHVQAARPTLIASSVPNPPGWILEIDGQRQSIHTVNGAFVGFFVPSGESEISLRYWPRTFTLGLLCCALGLALLGLAGIYRGRISLSVDRSL